MSIAPCFLDKCSFSRENFTLLVQFTLVVEHMLWKGGVDNFVQERCRVFARCPTFPETSTRFFFSLRAILNQATNMAGGATNAQTNNFLETIRGNPQLQVKFQQTLGRGDMTEAQKVRDYCLFGFGSITWLLLFHIRISDVGVGVGGSAVLA